VFIGFRKELIHCSKKLAFLTVAMGRTKQSGFSEAKQPLGIAVIDHIAMR
jgi:hypothetical protein